MSNNNMIIIIMIMIMITIYFCIYFSNILVYNNNQSHVLSLRILIKMDKLKQLATDSTRQQNPSWSNIYNTDIRNLFPKY